jgi:peptidyl-prolyl cis-trans isomerase C
VRDQLATDEGRLRYIRQYVAGEILYDKAKRLGFERNPQIIKAVDEYKKNIAVQALLQREVEQNLKVGADDLVLYYKANRERFLLPEKIKLAYREFTNKDKEEDLVAALKAGKGLRPEQWVEKGSLLIPDIGEAPEALSRLFKQEKGSVSGPLKIKDKTFIFFIEDKHPERQLSFEEVKNQVENEYRNKKQQDIINNVISKSLEQQEVEILFKPGKEK